MITVTDPDFAFLGRIMPCTLWWVAGPPGEYHTLNSISSIVPHYLPILVFVQPEAGYVIGQQPWNFVCRTLRRSSRTRNREIQILLGLYLVATKRLCYKVR
jgi:hypothetical protein